VKRKSVADAKETAKASGKNVNFLLRLDNLLLSNNELSFTRVSHIINTCISTNYLIIIS
jgi:hypothetical protein